MILINLFITFLKIGLLNFGGGNGIAAIINNEIINNKQWITKEEFVNMITISRITPGPIATNIATYVGMKTAGIAGAIIATGALITAPIIIMIIILLMLHKTSFLTYCLENLKPIIVALWIITIIILIENTYLKIENDKTEFLRTLAIVGINFFILFFYNKISPALVIILSGFFLYININMIKQKLKLSQNLNSIQLQTIKILSLNKKELTQLILEESENNEYLEIDSNKIFFETLKTYRFKKVFYKEDNMIKNQHDIALEKTQTNTSLKEHLLLQLRIQRINEDELKIGEILINNLNNKGFHIINPYDLFKKEEKEKVKK